MPCPCLSFKANLLADINLAHIAPACTDICINVSAPNLYAYMVYAIVMPLVTFTRLFSFRRIHQICLERASRGLTNVHFRCCSPIRRGSDMIRKL